MTLFHRLKAKYHHIIENKYIKAIKRKQYNLTISEEIISNIKLIAAILEVPQYVVCEHVLQVGMYHVGKVLNDPEKRQKLIDHLVQVHLLGDELIEGEELLMLGLEPAPY